jgi:hypothetical protein
MDRIYAEPMSRPAIESRPNWSPPSSSFTTAIGLGWPLPSKNCNLLSAVAVDQAKHSGNLSLFRRPTNNPGTTFPVAAAARWMACHPTRSAPAPAACSLPHARLPSLHSTSVSYLSIFQLMGTRAELRARLTVHKRAISWDGARPDQHSLQN